MALTLRALMPADERAARALLGSHFSGTRYRERMVELLESVLQFDDPEYLAVLAFRESDGELAGLALFGTVAGARAVVKIHAVVARELAVALALLEAVRDASERSGERLIVCEVPDDAPFSLVADALMTAGYSEEGRVPDFIRDGIALRLLVRAP